MNLFNRSKQNPERTRAAVDQPATSSDKSAWRACIKLLRFLTQLSDRIWKVTFTLLRAILIIFALVLFIAIFWRVFDWPGANWINGWLGTSWLATAVKWKTIRLYLSDLSVLVLVLGVYFAYKTARASEKAAKAQQQTMQLQQKANDDRMYNEAIANLDHQSNNVRSGGIHALDRLAKSNETYLLSIVEIFV